MAEHQSANEEVLALLRTRDADTLLAQLLMHDAVSDSLTELLGMGATKENAQQLLDDARENVRLIEQVMAERGFLITGGSDGREKQH